MPREGRNLAAPDQGPERSRRTRRRTRGWRPFAVGGAAIAVFAVGGGVAVADAGTTASGAATVTAATVTAKPGSALGTTPGGAPMSGMKPSAPAGRPEPSG